MGVSLLLAPQGFGTTILKTDSIVPVIPIWRYLADGRAGSGCKWPETDICSTSNQEKPTDEKNS